MLIKCKIRADFNFCIYHNTSGHKANTVFLKYEPSFIVIINAGAISGFFTCSIFHKIHVNTCGIKICSWHVKSILNL